MIIVVGKQIVREHEKLADKTLLLYTDAIFFKNT